MYCSKLGRHPWTHRTVQHLWLKILHLPHLRGYARMVGWIDGVFWGENGGWGRGKRGEAMVNLLWFIVVYLGSQQLVGQGGSVKMGGSLVRVLDLDFNKDLLSYSLLISGMIMWGSTASQEASRHHISWTFRSWSLTPPKINIDPENRPSQKERSLPTIIFQGLS